MFEFNANFSRGILLRLVVLTVALAAAVVASSGFLQDLYLRNQITQTGLLINGSILALFALGLGKVVYSLLRFMREERALGRFAANLEQGDYSPVEGVAPASLVVRRYKTVVHLSKQHTPINHSSLAAMTLAGENTRLSFPKFVNNTLILTGVFGTIVSLSIALVGASNLLDSMRDLGNMGLVIHGMSTALSTTITAIVCYLFYGYFFLKLSDAKTHFLSGLEQVTALHLLPKFTHSADGVLNEVVGLLRTLRHSAETLQHVQAQQGAAAEQLQALIGALAERVHPLGEDVGTIKGLLRAGFRLPEESE